MAMRMGLIGFDAARERLGYDTDESPTLDDLELIGWLIGRGDPSTGVPVEIGGQRGVPQTPRPGQAPPPAALVAAAPRTVSLNELTDLDTGALEYTVTQAEAALDRVIEKAGARLRSKAQSNPTLLALSDGVPNRLLPQTLKGRFAPTDVVSEADFDAVRKRILARWRRTATQAEATLARLVDAEPADPQQVDEDMRDGDSRLLAVLLAAALAALFTPDGTPDPAEVGEARDTRVPVTELREAMSIAGGGAPSYVDAGAWELIAGGRRTDQALRGIGAVSAGFEWRYGDPASRVRNFEPHQRLNGVRFETWTDDRLTVTADGSWVGGTHYRPGDHRGCLCLYTREVTLALAAAGNLDPAL